MLRRASDRLSLRQLRRPARSVVLKPRRMQFPRVHRDPVLHRIIGPSAGDALQMEGIVAGKIEAAVGRAHARIARFLRQRERRRAEVRVQSEGEGEVANGPAEGLLQFLLGRDHFAIQQPRIADRAKIGVGEGVGADLDARRRHRPKLFDRVRGETTARCQIVRKRLSLQHVAHGDEVRAGNPLARPATGWPAGSCRRSRRRR